MAALALVLPLLVDAQRFIGYYGKTAEGCPDYPSFAPSDLPVNLYTHLNYAFALINDQGIITVDKPTRDLPAYKEINALKAKNPNLRTAITIGGWDMNMAHYSEMVSTREKRQKFIKSAMAFVREHGFDGLDFDWEYPSDKKRGGHDADPENFVTFMREMRAAANAEVLNKDKRQERLTLSIALPGGPFHGDYFLVPKLAEHVDWFNIMAYNLHGPWETMVFCAAPLNDPALKTEFYGYSLVDAIHSMAPRTVNPQKFNLGLSLSGVTFTLQDKRKTLPGSPANGPGRDGCQERGAMAYFEAKKLMNNYAIADVKQRASDFLNRQVTQAPKMDDLSKCMYMVVDQDQWVGFDTPETFAYKVEYLKDYGFGGVSLWSMDSDTANHELTSSIHTSLNKNFHQRGNSSHSSAAANTTTSPKASELGPLTPGGATSGTDALGNKLNSAVSLTHQVIPLIVFLAAAMAVMA
ncbi:hypothetical protein EDD11_000495 [Mortierella claussenii]|nr:hypothetical protein EDD11_000495 [Mortierella claussenii]